MPSLADFCAVHLVRDGRRARADRRRRRRPGARSGLARALADRQAADGAAPVGPAAVARTGVAEINVEITAADLVREGVPGPERDAAGGARHPLGRDPAAVGARRGARRADAGDGHAPAARYTPELVEFAESVAAGAGLALDNARLFAEQEAVARALQRTLLPAELPEIPGVRLAARYRAVGPQPTTSAATSTTSSTAGDGEWALVIGDVVGKGAEAAAIDRARARDAAGRGPARRRPARGAGARRRGAAPAPRGRLLLRGARPHARRAGGGVEVRLLAAGHPPPLILRAGGALEEVAETGTLLG